MPEAHAGVKLRYKILGTLLAVVVVGLLALAIFVSHDSACGPVPLLPASATPMKAIASFCYGPPEVLKFQDLAKPSPADDEVLLRVHAASVNPLDWHFMRGTPYLVRVDSGMGAPKDPKLGVDVAGTIEAVGKNVKLFKPGDEVFGVADGAFAQYVSIAEKDPLVLKPANLSFEQAASVPIAAITALQALRDKGQLQPG
jgi:NADPH:quinone reductase-like Zn-dependent oxidoreductase